MPEDLVEFIKKVAAEHEARKQALKFALDFIEHKFRDGGRVTARDYQEFLAEFSKLV